MRRTLLNLGFGLLMAGTAVHAAEVRYYQENGVTYRETRYTVRHPVVETHLEDRQQTVYHSLPSTELHDYVRTYQVPVTEYHTETYLRGRWNPFVKPTMAERVKPITHWESRTEVVKVPSQRQQIVPATVTVRVPVTTQRSVDEEVVSRVAIGGTPTPSLAPGSQPTGIAPIAIAPAAQPANQTVVGGVSKLEQDPPRVGANYQWRPADPTRR